MGTRFKNFSRQFLQETSCCRKCKQAQSGVMSSPLSSCEFWTVFSFVHIIRGRMRCLCGEDHPLWVPQLIQTFMGKQGTFIHDGHWGHGVSANSGFSNCAGIQICQQSPDVRTLQWTFDNNISFNRGGKVEASIPVKISSCSYLETIFPPTKNI
jgi:hypothetical protein